MTHLDPNSIADRLEAIGAALLRDARTAPLSSRLAGLRREIGDALAAPVARCPTSGLDAHARQAMDQSGPALLPRRDLDAAVFVHGGRFADAGAAS